MNKKLLISRNCTKIRYKSIKKNSKKWILTTHRLLGNWKVAKVNASDNFTWNYKEYLRN